MKTDLSAAFVLPVDDKAPSVTITLKPVDVMTAITITDQNGDVTVSASFARQQIDQNGDVYSVAALPSVSRKFTVIAKTPDVQLAVNTLADLMVAARAEDNANG